jgi:uncharacterized protein YjbJ (UPF0337 family)
MTDRLSGKAKQVEGALTGNVGRKAEGLFDEAKAA